MQALKLKVFLLFIAYTLFMLLTMGMYWWNIDAFRERLTIMDEFHDVVSDILETRRYEKNFMFYPEPNSLKEALVYLDRAEKTVGLLQPKIIAIVGQETYGNLGISISEYRELLHQLAQGDKSVAVRTRQYGARLVESAQDLLKKKQQSVHNALDRILFLPIAVMLTVLILITLVYILQARKVLEHLKYVQRAADGVAKGDYEVIQNLSSEDPISILMRSAFRNMADELDTRQEQLVEARKLVSIGTLTSGIAHELNNPLNNVSLTADTLLEELDDLPRAEMRELLQDIINETGRASEVVRNLLDFSREEQRPLARLSMATVVGQTLRLVGNQLALHGIKVEVDVPEDLPSIRGDLHYLQQVFINLFLNADQAMEQGGLLRVVGRQNDEHLCVDVIDTGCGMDKATQERIFDPFFTTKPVGEGTGLGLSIIYGILKKHGGTISVESKEGKGTTLTVCLPIMNADEGV
ncbi:sensor histidine kinase [Pseudodesulfovibrio piezophilus]|uniref:histidine kinase n=1 Tax=Pseudodesulfovibrio piezophilus (strain DSM 21447 / JCM 15486 / C1TLV30) TaxID=1322246 RepID=M1WKR9_PSEP2|nr:HAMP domain-containing sensor histidine kinase [Pseudodesulfovibrio piezophilus]CCH50081.1 putative Integral membrane sensor signal transduction histidine kinase [Pseudodesulfovibrio piezophilus C1TLV30]